MQEPPRVSQVCLPCARWPAGFIAIVVDGDATRPNPQDWDDRSSDLARDLQECLRSSHRTCWRSMASPPRARIFYRSVYEEVAWSLYADAYLDSQTLLANPFRTRSTFVPPLRLCGAPLMAALPRPRWRIQGNQQVDRTHSCGTEQTVLLAPSRLVAKLA